MTSRWHHITRKGPLHMANLPDLRDIMFKLVYKIILQPRLMMAISPPLRAIQLPVAVGKKSWNNEPHFRNREETKLRMSKVVVWRWISDRCMKNVEEEHPGGPVLFLQSSISDSPFIPWWNVPAINSILPWTASQQTRILNDSLLLPCSALSKRRRETWISLASHGFLLSSIAIMAWSFQKGIFQSSNQPRTMLLAGVPHSLLPRTPRCRTSNLP